MAKSELQKEYQKQRRRIQQFIKRAEKRGYVFETNPLPATPKKITQASVSRLKKITPKQLYKSAIYIKEETGEAVSGGHGRYYEREKAARKAAETRRSIYNRFKDEQSVNYDINDFDGRDITDLETHDIHKPIVDKWMEIRNRLISEFPSSIRYYTKSSRVSRTFAIALDVQPFKNDLLSIWQDTYDRYGNDSSIELNNYVVKNEAKFSEAISKLPSASKWEDIQAHLSALATFLNGGLAVTQTQSEGLEELGNWYNYYTLDE